MEIKSIHILTIGYAKQSLIDGSREHLRMRTYAEQVGALHTIVFTHASENFTKLSASNFTAYPTRSRFRICMPFDALFIGLKIIYTERKAKWIISTQDPFEAGFVGRILSWITRVPLHIQLHGDYFTAAWSQHSPIRILRRAFGLLLLRHVPAIRVASRRIYESLVQKGISRNKITILPIRPDIESFLAISHNYKREPPFTFLYVGRLAPEKDILRIIKAFAALYHETHKVALRIVGSGSEEEKIQACITELGIQDHVTVCPWSEKPEVEMAAADVFLLASHHEAYALVLIESLAAGVPVITTDVGCVGELVKDGDHGIVVKEEGTEPYRDAMKKMIAEPARMELCGKRGKDLGRMLVRTTHEEYVRAWVTSISKALEKV